MSSVDDEFLQHLRATFRVEAQEHLDVITAGLLQLEQSAAPQPQEVVESVFRAAHSLKGAARAVELREVESVCEVLEDIFAAWKRKEAVPTPDRLDDLHARVTRITELLRASSKVASATAPAPQPAATRVQPGAALGDPQSREAHAAIAELRSPPAVETVRIGVDVLHAHLLEAEEMLAVKLSAGQRAEDLRELMHRLGSSRSEAAYTLAGGDHGQLRSVQRRLAGLALAAEQDHALVSKLVDELLANSKNLLLLPFATIAAPLPKLVRDLCREQHKQADLKLQGEHIALDKRILDAIKDPLIHLLRNAVDHGIEPPGERVRGGKPARAQITLSVEQFAAGKVQITLADDGLGIDADAVKAAAVRDGVVSADAAAALTESQAAALIFRSGVSTSPMVTGLSGRGLGLAIVQERAQQLGGEVSVESRPSAGTTFRIIVPALRATFRGILVEAGGRLFVVPTGEVEFATRVRAEDIVLVEGRETASVRGCVLPLVHLSQVLELDQAKPAQPPATRLAVVVLGRGKGAVALAVDHVRDEQELLAKPLQRPLARVRNIASATVLPTGRIALILHVPDVLHCARRIHGTRIRPALEQAAPVPKSILVAEDSITSRMLIKGVLEAAGYRVTTAVDGMDALGRLRGEEFDLLVSDVEMPRLNGFDLTARIRADGQLAELPVVLVTALESRDDRERGVDVGANAYIVKSSFDQTTLLDAVRRLL